MEATEAAGATRSHQEPPGARTVDATEATEATRSHQEPGQKKKNCQKKNKCQKKYPSMGISHLAMFEDTEG